MVMLRTIYNKGNYYHIGVGAVGLLIYPVLLAAVRTGNPKLLLHLTTTPRSPKHPSTRA